jgi:predicted ATP-grasp superfamily ATP-dependent carboligase
MPQSASMLIVGASARAAAMSAARAGLSPITADLFADVDLRRLCAASRVDDYPAGFLKVIKATACDGWIYTGALENHPELIQQLASIQPLWGNGAAISRAVRDPVALAETLKSSGLDSPAVEATDLNLPRDGSWLRKPRRSAGGAGIEPVTAAKEPHSARDVYFQQRIAGELRAAVFVSANGSAALLGVTRQLIGEPWTGASGFRYCGSIGPLTVSSAERAIWQQIGKCLARAFRLVGLWGVDAIVADDRVWPVEVNPRYTASVEVLERALGLRALLHHYQACTTGDLPVPIDQKPRACVGKAILYAPCAIRVEGDLAAWLATVDQSQQQQPWPDLADIPQSGSQIAAGWPIATLLTEASSSAGCETILQRRAAELFDAARMSHRASQT